MANTPFDMNELVSAINSQPGAVPPAPAGPMGAPAQDPVADVSRIASDDDSNATPAKNALDINSVAAAIMLINDQNLAIAQRLVALEQVLTQILQAAGPMAPEAPMAPQGAPVAPEAPQGIPAPIPPMA